MRTSLCCTLLLAVVLPSVLADPNWVSGATSFAMKGAKLAHSVTGATLNGVAKVTSGVPMVGKFTGSANDFYQEMSTLKGAIKILVRSIVGAFRIFGMSNIIALIKMFRDAVMFALESAKKILLAKLSSIPIVGSTFKNADDILNAMLKYGKAAGVPTEPIEASFTAFLLVVNGFMSAIF